MSWKQALSHKQYLIRLCITLVYVPGLVIFLNHFFPYIQQRAGKVWDDPLLAKLPPTDLSVWIFSVIYVSVITVLLYLLPHPQRLLRTLIAAAFIYTLRCITIYLFSLEPPSGIIPLRDPFIEYVAYDGLVITKDLFFSGHTAILLLCMLAVQHRLLKVFLGFTLTAVMIMLLWQHVHYTVDVIAALIVAPVCQKVGDRLARF